MGDPTIFRLVVVNIPVKHRKQVCLGPRPYPGQPLLLGHLWLTQKRVESGVRSGSKRPRSRLVPKGRPGARMLFQVGQVHVRDEDQNLPKMRAPAFLLSWGREENSTPIRGKRGEGALSPHPWSSWSRPGPWALSDMRQYNNTKPCSGLTFYCQPPQAQKGRFSGFPGLFPFHNVGHVRAHIRFIQGQSSSLLQCEAILKYKSTVCQ